MSKIQFGIGMKYGMEDARMEWKTIFHTILHTNSKLDFAHGIYRKIYLHIRIVITKNKQKCLAANNYQQIKRVIRL